MKKIDIYDTTLRDGAQSEDVSFSVEDKLRILAKLDEFGIPYTEGGWPGANPRDVDFFKEAQKLKLRNSKLAAFGSTHLAKFKVNEDPSIKAILAAKTLVVTIFGKTWDFHVKEALRVSLPKNLELIRDTVAYLKKYVPEVFFDAEHFFDGFKANPKYAMKCLKAAFDAGADCLVLCDTNGGTLPGDVGRTVKQVTNTFNIPIGIHAHNDSECAVASSLIAVENGATQVQGTINGLGERCGNANLISVIPSLKLKLKINCISDDKLEKLKEVSRFVTEIANLRHFKRQPFVGDSAFAHKGGVHASAVERNSETYEHIRPNLVGNEQRILASDLSGKSNIIRKIKDFKLKVDPDSPKVAEVVKELKKLENQGYQFEGAEASLELLIKKNFGLHKDFFKLVGYRVIVEKRKGDEGPISEATIKIIVNGKEDSAVGEGNGPVKALDVALRKALEKFYPQLKGVELADYKVRVLTANAGTSAPVRVLMEFKNGTGEKWSTVGVSENIIEASWQSLVDGIDFKLLREEEENKI
jgi:2-isopropylmalate synthase